MLLLRFVFLWLQMKYFLLHSFKIFNMYFIQCLEKYIAFLSKEEFFFLSPGSQSQSLSVWTYGFLFLFLWIIITCCHWIVPEWPGRILLCWLLCSVDICFYFFKAHFYFLTQQDVEEWRNKKNHHLAIASNYCFRWDH